MLQQNIARVSATHAERSVGAYCDGGMHMKLRVKVALCIALAVFAAVSLAAVLGSIGSVPASAESEAYLLRACDGYIGIYYPMDAEEPTEVTDIRVAALPAEDQEALRLGVSASNEEALVRLLEDYGA